MAKTTLLSFLTKTGKFTKTYQALQAIRQGKVKIKNKIITNPSFHLDPKKQNVRIENQRLKQIKKLYYILNKPKGYVCQKDKKELNIYQIINNLPLEQDQKNSLFSVGRLDKDTTGLLIITNDTKLSQKLTSPENKVEKEYYIKTKNKIEEVQIKELETGVIINLDEGLYKTRPAKVAQISQNEILIKITEGKKRQIRKMFETLENEILELKRTKLANLQLPKDLKEGEIKQIKKEEILTTLR